MKKRKKQLEFSVIRAASHGDVEAISKVLAHYDGYINALARRKVHDDDGNTYIMIDAELKRRLEAKLIVKILEFKIA